MTRPAILDGGLPPPVTHRFTTPEGVPLEFEIPRSGARIAAFVLDYLLVTAISILLTISMLLVGFATGPALAVAIGLLAFFLLQNFYFVWGEIRGRGATFGKRFLRLKAVDVRGGPLTAEAVIARNLTRNVEIFIPVMIALNPETVVPGAPPWVVAVAIVWFFVLGLLPLFNRDRRRIGDLISGTVVVRAPRATLLEDLSRKSESAPLAAKTTYTFRPDQLELYGVFELQVLEDVLRGASERRREALDTVCDRIKRKIGWDPAHWNVASYRFLMDFYAAQRRHLEQKMLLGRRKESKLE